MSVSTDGFEAWNDAVRRAESGETVAVVAHGKHVADGTMRSWNCARKQ